MVLIFDYDGTLHETAHLYGHAFRQAYRELVEMGYAPQRYYSDDEMSKYLGMTAKEMWHSFMPELPENIAKQISALVGENMVSGVKNGMARLYEGAAEVLCKLHSEGNRMVILSNCHESYMNAHRECFSLDDYFDGYFTAQAYSYAPKEEIARIIISEFTDKQYAVIGDRESDFKAALSNALPFIGCEYGYGTKQELAASTKIIKCISELPDALKEL